MYYIKKTNAILANGVVIDPYQLQKEIEDLNRDGIELENRFFISKLCQIVLPYHKLLDSHRESKLGKNSIGTTKKGIGPAYTDKITRCGFRICDITSKDFKDKLTTVVDEKKLSINKILQC